MTVTVAPPPFLQFFNPNNSGSPAVNFKLFTYQSGSSTKQSTWTDSTQSSANANPLQLNGNGYTAMWGDPTISYKLVWAPANDTDPPTSPLYTLDNFYFPANLGVITQSLIGSLLYPRTTPEIAAGVTPVNYAYQTGDARRYGADPTGAVDSTVAINNSISVMYQVAASGGGGFPAIVNLPCGTYKISSSIIAKSYITLLGGYGEDGTFGAQNPQPATVLNWVGSGAGPILKCFDVRLFKLDGIMLQGNGGTSLVGILLDSDNNPSGSQNEFHRFSIRGCFLGVQWGTSGLSPGYANDSTRFVNGTIWSSVTNSSGIIINSGNAADQSVIDGVGIEVQNMGIYVLVASILKITRCFFGNNVTGGAIVVSTAIGLTISECSSEGWGGNPAQSRSTNSTFMTVNAPQGGFAVNNFTITLIQNQINNPIQVNFAVRILSLGDNWGQCASLVGIVFTAPPTGTSATLTSNWGLSTGAYTVFFSDGESRSVTLTNGATTATWTGSLTGTPTINATVTSFIVNAVGTFTNGISSLVQINNGVNPGAIDVTTGPFSNTPTQGWQDSAFVDISRIDPWLGVFQPSFTAGSYGGNGAMTWTVSAGNVTFMGYTLQGRVMTIYFNISNSSIGGTLNTDLTLLIPASKTPSQTIYNTCITTNNAVQAGGIVLAISGSTLLRFRLLAGGNWSASAANAGVQGQISFEVN